MNRISIREVIVVEGKYDKIKLESLVDATIITTDGFRVFADKEKQALLRRLADERGLLLLTDSDSAGFVIRNFLRGCVSPDKLRHAYIPQLYGKEKRKSKPSKEGLLGVEGIEKHTLLDILERAGVTACSSAENKKTPHIDKQRFYDDGLVGQSNSSLARERLAVELGLPSTMTANALIEAVNLLCSEKEYIDALRKISGHRHLPSND